MKGELLAKRHCPAFQVDTEFKRLIPSLSEEELALLESNLLAEGCRDPLVLWNGTLLDGHNRYEICTRHGIAFSTVEAPGITHREEAIHWIINNQLGRRNLTPDQASYLRRVRYRREKKAAHRPEKGGQNVHLNSEKTAEKLAKAHGVNEKTIRRDSQFAEALDSIAENVGEDFRRLVLSPQSPFTKKDILALVCLDPAQQREAVKGKKKPHVAHNSGENEWYTPAKFITAARAVMGGIDLDPASSPLANEIVKAPLYYTQAHNGLAQPWWGNVWLNPPYAQPLITLFAKALVEKYRDGEFQQACVLVNNATETGWFQALLAAASAVCFVRGRVKFLDPQGNPSGAPLQGQAVLYFGGARAAFIREFTLFGIVKE